MFVGIIVQYIKHRLNTFFLVAVLNFVLNNGILVHNWCKATYLVILFSCGKPVPKQSIVFTSLMGGRGVVLIRFVFVYIMEHLWFPCKAMLCQIARALVIKILHAEDMQLLYCFY